MLSNKDYEKAANSLGCSVAAVKAVTEVEAKGSGFLPTGEPVILYERHIMRRLLKEKGISVEGLPVDLVNSSAGGYGKYSKQHEKLQRACLIDRECALQSCSWGLFQVMGFHWRPLGYKSIQEFINAQYKSEEAQLDTFVRFIKNDQLLLEALKMKDWRTFARIYNGPAYAKNQYDRKLAAAYAKHK